ncbi:60S ribosomal export protein NMD3 [Porphyridium purpureum]|uniref:60S ribosomal export protein NMD3 n=1 Tax=Porphyridium purpureum TaxID=35688 RepID=A0A5J4YI00_PORPP|nr:60S ribosomal export protein NMD3 [Porphyridium purpureum]|eukprot:POR6270..scf297_16
MAQFGSGYDAFMHASDTDQAGGRAAAFVESVPRVLCCLCGVLIDANPAGMCANCLRSQVDITEGIPKQSVVYFCKFCERYHVPPRNWVRCELESKELLALLIKRLKGLNKVKLVDAGFKWTEPHSRRIIVRLCVQKEVFTSTVLQQEFLIEFVVEHLQCDSCKRDAANMDAWTAVVQLRQKVDHKRTFMYLEQLILKHNAHEDAIGMKNMPDGLDFYFMVRSHANKFLHFVTSVVPLRHKTSEHLISHDESNNTFRYKYSFSAEISPLCRDDLVVLPPKVAAHLGGIGPLVLVLRVAQNVLVMDVRTFRTAEVSSPYYWKNEFGAILGSRRLTEFTVLDSEPTGEILPGGAGSNKNIVVTDVTVCRSADLGMVDRQYFVRSHLGHHLQAGDLCLGYDIENANVNEDLMTGHKKLVDLPDVVLVRKTYPKRNRARTRRWKLRRLAMEEQQQAAARGSGASNEEDEHELFMQELEQDPEMRSHVNLYMQAKDPVVVAQDDNSLAMRDDSGAEDEEEDEDYPDVPVTELLEGLAITEATTGPEPGGDEL